MFIAGTRRGEMAVNLAFHLQNCEGGYEIPEDCNFLVNYGRGNMPNADLNPHLIGNKLTQLKVFRDNGLQIPDFYPINWNVSRHYHYPLIARKYFHTKGKDAIFLKTRGSWRKRLRRVATRHYFVKYIPKAEEFRVHVCGEEVIGISTKVPFEDEVQHPHIWSRDRGWGQVDYNGPHAEKLCELGVKALKALKYDFGAVDIFLGKDGKFYLLEVNSAPRLNRRRRKLYAQFFRKKYHEKYPRRR
jgi:glutathione synthase/RimK-type ligase-like ATP-grasp enzyme